MSEHQQRPSVGRVVHYVSHGTPIRADGSQAFQSQCRAADITEVDPENPNRVGLMVKNPTGLFFHSLADGGSEFHGGDFGADHNGDTITDVSYHGGSWHWPERV